MSSRNKSNIRLYVSQPYTKKAWSKSFGINSIGNKSFGCSEVKGSLVKGSNGIATKSPTSTLSRCPIFVLTVTSSSLWFPPKCASWCFAFMCLCKLFASQLFYSSFSFSFLWNAPASCSFLEYGSLCIFLSTERNEILVWLTVLTNVPNPMFDFTFCITLGEVGESFVWWIFLCLVNFFWYGNDFPHSGQAFVAFGSFSFALCALAVCLFRLFLNLVS